MENKLFINKLVAYKIMKEIGKKSIKKAAEATELFTKFNI